MSSAHWRGEAGSQLDPVVQRPHVRRSMPSSKACMRTTPPFGEPSSALRRGGIDWRRSLTSMQRPSIKPAQASPQLDLETSAQRRGGGIAHIGGVPHVKQNEIARTCKKAISEWHASPTKRCRSSSNRRGGLPYNYRGIPSAQIRG